MYDFCDLEIGARFIHKKTGVVWKLTDVGRVTAGVFALIIKDPAGRSVQTTPAILENLYTVVEEPEPIAALPIGSMRIESIEPEPEPGPPEELPELVFRRKGRPENIRRPDFKSYFGEPRKEGPRKKPNE